MRQYLYLLVYQAVLPGEGPVIGNFDITASAPLRTHGDVYRLREVAAEKCGVGPGQIVILNIIPLPIGLEA